jgi:hypothetical protein
MAIRAVVTGRAAVEVGGVDGKAGQAAAMAVARVVQVASLADRLGGS